MAGTANANGNIITNIGATGSSFTTSGSLALILDAADANGVLQLDNSSQSNPIFNAKDNGTTVFQIADGGLLTVDPATTGTLIDMALATQWTTGTLINAGFASSTTQSGAITGINLNFNANYTAATANGSNLTGLLMSNPGNTTFSTGSTTNVYTGIELGTTSGTYTTNNASASFTYNGVLVTTPNITQTSGTISANGLAVTLGTVTTQGIQDGLKLTLPTGTGSITTAGTINGIEFPVVTTGPSAGTMNGLKIGGVTTSSSGGTINGINIGNVTTSGGTDNAISIGTGWDNDLKFSSTGVKIQTPASGANAVSTLTFQNNASTAIPLLQLRDLTGNSAQFGALAISDAFMSKQSYLGEEFNMPKATCSETPTSSATNHAGIIGDFGNPTTGAACTNTNTGSFSTSDISSNANSGTGSWTMNAANGYVRMSCTGTAARTDSCLMTNNSGVAGAQNTFINTGNFPQIMIKFRPATVPATANYYYVGAANLVAAVQPLPANNAIKGAYFSNCSTPTGAAIGGCGNTWFGVINDGTNAANTVACAGTDTQGNAPQSTTFMYGRIEFRKATSTTSPEVEFFVDYDVSNGIVEKSCGTITSTTTAMGNTAMGALFMAVSASTITATSLDVDYFRVWQDDAPTQAVAGASIETNASSSSNFTEVSPSQSPISVDDSAQKDNSSRTVLVQLMTQLENQSHDSSIDAPDRLMASKELITPKVVTHEMATDFIKASTTNNIIVNLNENGMLKIQGEASESAMVVDGKGNATFSGQLTAKTIKADTIEGLSVMTDKIVLNKLNTLISENRSLNKDIPISNQAVLGASINKNGLTIDVPAEFKSKSIFDSIVEFVSHVIFRGDVDFLGRPTFNADTGGYATIRQGEDSIRVDFSKEYQYPPIVNASIVIDDVDQTDPVAVKIQKDMEESLFNDSAGFIITQRSAKGFTIKLKQPSLHDLKFNWTAIAIKDPLNAINNKPLPEGTPSIPISLPISSPVASESTLPKQ
jgi:hypothetical protein